MLVVAGRTRRQASNIQAGSGKMGICGQLMISFLKTGLFYCK
jgi:hypothetical protein